MSRKKKTELGVLLEEMTMRLEQDYSRWKSIYESGCSDPSWSDGVNINLVRNHILHGKKQLESLLGDKYVLYPDNYFYPEPPELSNDFMAVTRYLGVKGVELKATIDKPYAEVMKFDLE